MEKTICELFAGVGGFRLGFEKLHSGWKTVWFSQWEPGAKRQWAHECYVRHFGDCLDDNGKSHTGLDIAAVNKNAIPSHSLLVGGFPCQDYSVAHSLSSAHGIEGKKGILWWQIRDTMTVKHPAFCVFENVDRLLKSPAKQRGRDFGIILACLHGLGYDAEWRVINAAKYGAAQKRKRLLLFAYHRNTNYSKRMKRLTASMQIRCDGLMSQAFPIMDADNIAEIEIGTDLAHVSEVFSFAFRNAGCVRDGRIVTVNVTEQEEAETTLGDILEKQVDEQYYIPEKKINKWEYLKSAKKLLRTSKTGHSYVYSEGAMAFPDSLDRPGRTMLTSEGTCSRCSHVVQDQKTKRLRILTPIEAERLQGFPDGWTAGMPERMRYFCMGNALVVPMITRIGRVLDQIIADEA